MKIRLALVIVLLIVQAVICGKGEACALYKDYLILGSSQSTESKTIWAYNVTSGYPYFYWSKSYNPITCLSVDTDKNIYCGYGDYWDDGSVYKLKWWGDADTTWGGSGGDVPGQFNVHSFAVSSVIVDTDDKCYIGCSGTEWWWDETRYLIRLNSNGTIDQNWGGGDSRVIGGIGALAFMASNYIVVGASGGSYYDVDTLHKVNKSYGTVIWRVRPSATDAFSSIKAVAVDGSKIYCGGTRDTTNRSVWRYTDGLLQPTLDWYADTGGIVKGMCFLPGGGLCVVGDRNNARPGATGYESVWLYDSSGNLLNSGDTGGYTYCVLTDGSYFYVGGERVCIGGTTYRNVWRFDSDLSNKTPFIDTDNVAYDMDSFVYSIAYNEDIFP